MKRFWDKVDKSGDCWIWTACCNKDGYGRFGIGRHKTVLAHRHSYELEHGSIQASAHVLHKCDNPPCVNPAHLFIGDQVSNMLDRDQKGRVAKGEAAGPSKLSADQVREIRARANEPRQVLADEFGMSLRGIGSIIARDNWRHI